MGGFHGEVRQGGLDSRSAIAGLGRMVIAWDFAHGVVIHEIIKPVCGWWHSLFCKKRVPWFRHRRFAKSTSP